ncbi:MAG TPA: hypothetical protein VMH48_03515 [Methylomirabilota bacterium]|nr:hypothetical protein [Methylomirabilota bacterium]
MATPAQPSTSKTTLAPTDTRKPSIDVSGDSPVIQAIVLNQAFPASPTDITLAQLNAQASTGGQFNLPGVNNAPVSFDLSASANAGLAAYQTPSKIVADLGFASGDGKQLNISFPPNSNDRFLAVRWGFDISGKLAGKMALNPAVNVNFGASGSADGLFAFVATVDKSVPAGTAFLRLLDNWCTPAAVADGSSSLPAGCWIISEVTGQLQANLGVTGGYDFNWVKSLKLNDLQGDIGLRISLGLQAMLSAQLGGKYYLVLNRESASSGVRLRLFRATTKGWGFALHTGANITLSTGTLTPANLNDFIRAILGIHDAQLLKFLEASSLSDISNALGGEFLKALRIDGDINQAFSDLQGFFQKWNDLPRTVTSVIWKYANDIPGLTQIQQAAQKISQLQESDIKSFLDSLLHDVSFTNNPVVEWLEATAASTLFDLFESDQLSQLRTDAAKLAALLDGSTLQNFLTGLKGQVDTALNLPALENALNANDLTGVAVWVTQQLANFAGVDLSQLKANIAKINAAIKTVRDKAQQIYAATVKALNNTYGFSLDYAYNASSTDSALIDLAFADSARSSLADAIRGDFSQIFSTQIPGVTLNTCTLAHAIQRHTHVETHLPWMTGISDDLATGFANATLADSDSGRVQFFEAGATDTLTTQRNTNLKRFASCSIGISGQAKGVRQYNVTAVDFGYSFITAKTAMTDSQFDYEFGPSAAAYFSNVFGAKNPDPNRAPFGSWVKDWDSFAAQSPGATGVAGVIGNTWANLQVRRRAQSGVDWVAALLNKTVTPDYQAMSRAMQESIRKFLLVAYASDPSRFKNVPKGNPTISGFFVYAALPPANDFSFDGSTLKPKPNGDIVWDVRDTALATAVTNTFALAPLQANFARIFNLLRGIPQLQGSAGFYDNTAPQVLGSVTRNLLAGDPYITLLENEKTVIDGAQAAFEKLRQTGSQPLLQALPDFSKTLIDLVSKFNSGLSSLSLDSPQVMRLFAPLVFQSAVEAMLGTAAKLPFDATLDVAVLKGATLPDLAQPPAPADTLLRQRIASFA